jgi:E3 ubiquitin-protein ligase HECTD2
MYLVLKIHRENILEDTLTQISNSNINFKKPMRVAFIGEPGIDEGGVRKEFF